MLLLDGAVGGWRYDHPCPPTSWVYKIKSWFSVQSRSGEEKNLPTEIAKEQCVKKPLSHGFPDVLSGVMFLNSISVWSWKSQSGPFKSTWFISKQIIFTLEAYRVYANVFSYHCFVKLPMFIMFWIYFSFPFFFFVFPQSCLWPGVDPLYIIRLIIVHNVQDLFWI